MTRFPALALIELDSVAVGIRVADLMVKRAPIALLKTGTVHPGHYLVLIGGTVAAVTESHQAGLEAVADAGRALERTLLLDQVLLPEVHPQAHDAALGARFALELDSLGVLETQTVASVLRAADAAVKGARVRIAELRMADDLGGRAFVLFDGLVADVEAALDIGAQRVPRELLVACIVIPRLDASVRVSISAGTRFAPGEPFAPDGAESGRIETSIGAREDAYFGK
jgi:microcompartment protein CcmL/EutN